MAVVFAYLGASRLALRPISTEQVSDAMKLCNNWKLGVVPQGGNTSLVGTSTPVFDEVVISTRAMNKIISIDGDTGRLLLYRFISEIHIF